jgi:hypothetical protein
MKINRYKHIGNGKFLLEIIGNEVETDKVLRAIDKGRDLNGYNDVIEWIAMKKSVPQSLLWEVKNDVESMYKIIDELISAVVKMSSETGKKKAYINRLVRVADNFINQSKARMHDFFSAMTG